MNIAKHNETRFELGADQMLKFQRTPRVRITCTAGEIWVTEGGVGKDVILARGATYASRGKGDVIAYAHEPSGLVALRFPSLMARWVQRARTIAKRRIGMKDYARPTRAGRAWLANSQS